MACFATAVMVAAPLASLRQVLARRSARAMPTAFVLANFVAQTAWFAVGLFTHDSLLVLANGAGAFVAAGQAALLAVDRLVW